MSTGVTKPEEWVGRKLVCCLWEIADTHVGVVDLLFVGRMGDVSEGLCDRYTDE